jgi:hypothetical protein
MPWREGSRCVSAARASDPRGSGLGSIQGRIALWQRAGRRVERLGSLGPVPWVEHTGPRCARAQGFSLHANLYLAPRDPDQRERSCRDRPVPALPGSAIRCTPAAPGSPSTPARAGLLVSGKDATQIVLWRTARMATTDVPHAQRLGRGEAGPEARWARPQPAVPALTVSGESAVFYLWFNPSKVRGWSQISGQ